MFKECEAHVQNAGLTFKEREARIQNAKLVFGLPDARLVCKTRGSPLNARLTLNAMLAMTFAFEPF